MSSSNLESNPTPCMTGSPLEAAQPKSAKIERVTHLVQIFCYKNEKASKRT
jgi:hypothetical protein